MKRFTFCSSVLFMLVLTGLGFADEHFPFLGAIKRGGVNVRAGANTNFESVDKLAQGAQVVVLGQSYEWYKIQLPSTAVAFIRADYLKEYSARVGELTGDRVNVRAKPNSESSVLSQLHKGDLVKFIDKVGDWYKVEPPATAVGWVHTDFVRVEAPQVPDQILRKPLTADSIPPPAAVKSEPIAAPGSVVVQQKGSLLPLIQAPAMDVHYQIVVDGKPVYYVQDAPHLEHFSRAQVNIEGILSSDKTATYPVLHIKKITLIL